VDRLDAMKVFVAVAELRGFAPAARRQKLSPSVVTRMIAALEQQLGARLMQRTTRSVTLTDAGARYLERARRILADVAEAEGEARAERTDPAGRLVLAAPNVFGRLHVAPLVSSFLAKHPAVTGELMLSDRNASLVEEGIDAAIRIGVLEDSSLVARKVGVTRRVVVGSARYLAKRKRPAKPAELAEHELVHFTGLSATPEWRFEGRGQEARVAITPRLTTNSADAAIQHVLSGGGLTMALGYQVIALVRAKKLRVVLADFEPEPLPIHVLYPTTRLLSAKVRALVDCIQSTCDWRFVSF
jgi:DNA-binding transcriptional LysR family regulator